MSRRLLLLTLPLALLCGVEPSSSDRHVAWERARTENGVATGWFDPVPFHGPATTTYLVLGDLDMDVDLDPDIVGTSFTFSAVHRNDGGVFQISDSLGQFDRGGLALGDLDGDGDLDAFLGGWNEDRTGAPARVFLNNGIFNFTDAGFEYDDKQTVDVVLGDVDGDGDLDAITVNDTDFSVLWINQQVEGGADGEFVDEELLGFGGEGSAELGDLDGDGDLDLVMPSNFGEIRVHENDGNVPFKFDDVGIALGTDFGAAHVALGDLDGDGDLDTFVSEAAAESVWLNTTPTGGPIAFADSGQRLGADEREPRGVALGDLDADGDLDAVVGRFPQSAGTFFLADAPLATITVWINDGKGRFRHSGQCLARTGPPLEPNDCELGLGSTMGWAGSPVLADVDGDTDLDLVTAHCDGFRVWYNGGPPDTQRCCAVERGIYGIDHGSSPLGSLLSRGRGLLETLGGAISGIDVGTYHQAQDELLPGSADGQAYLDFYATHNDELVDLLVADPALALDGVTTLALWTDHLQALMDGNGDTATITQEQVDALDAFLADVATAGSPGLAQAISDRLAAIPPLASLVGATMEDVRDDVIGPPLGADIFGDGFESGDTGAWDATVQ